jgi:hypothetical protein
MQAQPHPPIRGVPPHDSMNFVLKSDLPTIICRIDFATADSLKVNLSTIPAHIGILAVQLKPQIK